MAIYTVLEYQYRDAGNYRAFGEILIEGEVLKSDLDSLAPYLYDGEYFIPEEVGIPPLQPMLWEEFGSDNENDHDWHTFVCVRECRSEDMTLPVWGSKEELIQRFQGSSI